MQAPFPFWLRDVFESSDDIVYVLDEDLRIADCNSCWDKFAAENGGVGLALSDIRGRKIFEFIPTVLWGFYKKQYAEVRRSAQWLGFDYECSSPERIRLFHMSMKWVAGYGTIVVNSHFPSGRGLLPPAPQTVKESLYTDSFGSISMCAHCRQTQRQDQPELWEWIPQFVRDYGKRPVEHALCPPCRTYFYPPATLT